MSDLLGRFCSTLFLLPSPILLPYLSVSSSKTVIYLLPETLIMLYLLCGSFQKYLVTLEMYSK